MQRLLFIFIFVFAVSAAAQSSAVTTPFNAGTKFARAGDFESALLSYREALRTANHESVTSGFIARLHYDLGVCDYQLGHNEQAVEQFNLAIDLKGGDYPRAHYALGMAESARRNWAQARDAFIAGLRSDKDDGEAWFDLAVAYLGEGDMTGAEAAFRNAIARGTIDGAVSHNNLGVLLVMRGEVAAARAEFDTAVGLSDGKLAAARENLEYCRLAADGDVSKSSRLETSGRNGSLRRDQ